MTRPSPFPPARPAPLAVLLLAAACSPDPPASRRDTARPSPSPSPAGLAAAPTPPPADPPRRAAAPLADVRPPVESPDPSAEPRCPARTADLPLPPGIAAADPRLEADPLLVVRKGVRRLALYRSGRIDRDALGRAFCCPVALGIDGEGRHPEGPKRVEGDRRTPEGWYRTTDKPRSAFYRAIFIHYPNRADAEAALADGRIDAPTYRRILEALEAGRPPPQDTPLGGLVLLHGGGASADWTHGCIALDDPTIDDLHDRLGPVARADLLVLP